MDGVLVGNEYTLSDWDLYADFYIKNVSLAPPPPLSSISQRKYLERCDTDPECSKHFVGESSPPSALLLDTLQRVIQAGHCPEGVQAMGSPSSL